MELVTTINPYRDRLVDLVSKYTDEKTTIWVRKTLSLMIRKAVTVNDFYVVTKVTLTIKNMYRFFKMFRNEELGIYIAISLYVACIELKLLELGNELESYESFMEVTDSGDWKQLDILKVVSFDLNNGMALYERWANGEQLNLVILGCHTACMIDALLQGV